MFKRAFRLPANVQFINPRFISTEFVTIKTAKNTLGFNRFGFVISKRVAKNAVDRNRSKRKIRACVESMHKQMLQNHDFLFIVKKSAAETPVKHLANDIAAGLRKQGFLL